MKIKFQFKCMSIIGFQYLGPMIHIEFRIGKYEIKMIHERKYKLITIKL